MSKCSQSSLPDFESLQIPSDINVGFVPASNETWYGMKQCCSPNPVHKATECVLWCEVSDAFMDSKAPGQEISRQLKQCLDNSGVNTTEVLITGGHVATSAATSGTKAPSLGGLGLLVLLVVGFLGPKL